MPDTSEEGPHVHHPCERCGLVEAELDGLCPECATQTADPVVEATGQGPDPETAKLER
jgi:hypothetical protein